VLACGVVLLAGCGLGSDDAGPQPAGTASAGALGGSAAASAPPAGDADALLEQALAAREANDPAGFAALVLAAAQACPVADAASRLGQVAVTAQRWSGAVLDGRPKAQAVTEAQLAEVDWDALGSACTGP
jgi:hypothetical protein